MTLLDFPVGFASIILAGIGDQFFRLGEYWPLFCFVVLGTLWWSLLGYKADSSLGSWLTTLHRDPTETRKKMTSLIGFHILPLLHLCVLALSVVIGKAVILKVLFVLDFPISFVVELLFQSVDPLFSLGLMGTLWWYVVSREIRGVYGIVKRLRAGKIARASKG